MNLDDTIVAIATPPGRGGIGVVRLAGDRAQEIAFPMLRLKQALEPGRAVFGELIEPDSRVAAECPAFRANDSEQAAHVGTAALGCPSGPEVSGRRAVGGNETSG